MEEKKPKKEEEFKSEKEKKPIEVKAKFIESKQPSFFKVSKEELRSTIKNIFKKKTNN